MKTPSNSPSHEGENQQLLPSSEGRLGGVFKEAVLQIVKNIPSGQTMTYGQVAAEAGRPGAARAVGTIMSHNWDPAIPCHRVIRSDGKVGGYNRGTEKKVELLETESAVTR